MNLQRGKNRTFLKLLASALTLILCGAGCFTSQTKQKIVSPPAIVAPSTEIANLQPISEGDRLLSEAEVRAFVGDKVCSGCHEAVCKGFGDTRHAKTLKAVAASEFSSIFKLGTTVADANLKFKYKPVIENGKCVMLGVSGERKGSLPVDYVMGTGRNAYTFFSAESPNSWVDLRLSYYTGDKKWDFTPMQKPGDRLFTRAAGIEQKGSGLVGCLKCHVTFLKASAPNKGSFQGVDISKSHIGIGCERCHGPGKPHLDAVASTNAMSRRDQSAGRAPSSGVFAGKTERLDLKTEDFKRSSPERINQLCGSCHHNDENSRKDDPKTENGLARFEGVALARSRCFRESGALSCITCHNPHEDASKNRVKNEADCLNCHSSASHPTSTFQKSLGKICPVNPKTGCIPCHMPAQIIPSIPFAKYHNHYIKVWNPLDKRGGR